MLFELSNTLATFHSYINKFFSKNFNVIVFIYIENIVIYIKKRSREYRSHTIVFEFLENQENFC